MTFFHHEADCRTHGRKTFVSIAKSSFDQKKQLFQCMSDF